jgi:peptidoglycan/xylan/chitin deacetylase (PgdA/CDA1 family)
MLNIMHHYVRPYSKEYPNLNSLSINTFKKQLDFFKKKYGFLSKYEYQSAIKEGKNPKGVVLTFDDGLKDHIDYVLPELVKRGLWGIFYISTGVYYKNKLLGVHRIHYLMGKYGAKKILNEVLKEVNSNMLDHNTIGEFDKEIYIGGGYKDDERKLKRLLNYYISYKYRDEILNKLMKKFFNEEELFKEVYLSIDDIKKLALNGSIVGSHTVTHKVLSRLSYQEQYSEIESSFNFINRITKQDYKSFAYPYGYKSSYNSDTLKVLEELNVDDACIFDNKAQQVKIKRYELSRIDCNQFLEV